MNSRNAGLGIILHSGSYDRICNALSAAMVAGALGRSVVLFFSYGALEYLRKESRAFNLEGDSERYREIIEKNIKRGHLKQVPELIAQAKEMGAKVYACTNSMGLLNIAADELAEEVDKCTGLSSFLVETHDYQLLFV